jgi:hypothetical protein
MLSSTLNFLKDNQAVLSWIGGGIVAVATGIWAVVKFIAKSGDQKPSKQPSVNADHGSIAAGRDISVNARGSYRRSKTPK